MSEFCTVDVYFNSGSVYMENRTTRASQAFTLIEMVIVIVIMGLLMAVAVPSYNAYRTWAKRNQTNSNLRTLQQAIDNFSMMTDSYPTKLEDLITKPADEKIAKKWPGNLLKRDVVPRDAWDNEFHYQQTKGGKHPYELYSDGDPAAESPQKFDVWDI